MIKIKITDKERLGVTVLLNKKSIYIYKINKSPTHS